MRTVRLAGVSLRLDLERATDVAAFTGMVEEILDAHVPPHPSAPTLVAFPEHTGLLTAFVGERGRAARQRLAAGAPALEGLLELAGAYGEALEHYAGRFPEVTAPGTLLHLALTDTCLRALHDTFARLAVERRLWLSVGAALPDWTWADDAPAALRHDACSDAGGAYVATSPHVRNRNLVFAPDGTLAALQDKAYLVPMERDREAGLGLSAATLPQLTVIGLEVGRVASVISKDAWMPDVNERLDQLGAQLLLQPEAFDRWGRVDRDGDREDLWPPDKLQRGGWWMLQRHRAFCANVTPMLVGNLGDLAFDGQALIAVATPGGADDLGLLGQPPDGGWAAVGRWSDLERTPRQLADPHRRARFEQHAARLAPGSGSPLEGRVAQDGVWADVDLPEPAAPRDGPTRPAVLGASVEVVDLGTGLVPDLAADGVDVWLAWVACDPRRTQGVLVARREGRGWAAPEDVTPRPPRPEDQLDRQWRPRLAATGGTLACLHLDFARESWDLVAAVRSSESWDGDVRVDDAHTSAGVLRERGHDAPVVVADPSAPGRLVAVWSDLRWPWVLPQVRRAESRDHGHTWSPSVRVDGGVGLGEPDPLRPRSVHETRGQTAPTAALADRLLVAWQERDDVGHPTVWLVDEDDANGPRRMSPPGQAAHRPRLAASGGRVWLAWEREHPAGGGGLWWCASDDGGSTFTPAAPLEATPGTGVTPGADGPSDGAAPAQAVQRHAELAAIDDRRAVVVFGDDRAGPERILACLLDGATARAPVRVCDTPGQARAPAAVWAGGRLVVAWQDTRSGTDRIRTLEVPLAALAVS